MFSLFFFFLFENILGHMHIRLRELYLELMEEDTLCWGSGGGYNILGFACDSSKFTWPAACGSIQQYGLTILFPSFWYLSANIQNCLCWSSYTHSSAIHPPVMCLQLGSGFCTHVSLHFDRVCPLSTIFHEVFFPLIFSPCVVFPSLVTRGHQAHKAYILKVNSHVQWSLSDMLIWGLVFNLGVCCFYICI